MDSFPSNSRRPARPERDEPKNIERVATGDVVRRKSPLTRRFSQLLFGGDPRSVGQFMFGEVMVPAARDAIVDAFTGGVERMIFGEGSSRSNRRRGGHSNGHTAYNRYSSPSTRNGREDRPREISQRGRQNHSFDEIILKTRVEAEEVLDQLDSLVDRYDGVSVADLYRLVGVTSTFTDQKWGWTELRGCSVQRVRDGYLLNLPRPEPID